MILRVDLDGLDTSRATDMSCMFFGCSSLESITFEGDAPKLWQEVFRGVSPNCTVFVRKGTKGWGVEIPGKWNGMKIAFSR